jgi:NAD(P)-dependent dehydrogenase (short-subunit alcohol dehydrogenase family)
MNRTALVIGAAGGVGTEVVKLLLDGGYQVIGSVLDDREAAHVKATTPGVGRVLRLDLSKADSVLAELKHQAIPKLDAVVVCAAISPFGPVEMASLEVLRRTLEINTIAAAAIFQGCMPALRAAKGRLVLISSFAGKIGLPFIGHYVASKHALEGLADVMRFEAKSSGVDLVLVEPGGIRTPMVANQVRDVTRERAELSAENAARYGAMYDTFLGLVKKSQDGMLDPSAVAKTILEALRAPVPLARYQVGEDSKFLCDVARKPDVEKDAIVAGFWGS